MKKRFSYFLPCCFMIGVIALSNILVAIPLGPWLTAGALTFPLTFLVNDLTNHYYGAHYARNVVYLSLLPAFLISFLFSTPRIALASLVAFFLAQLLDIFIFDKLRQRKWWRAPLVSTFLSSLIDTTVFYGLAFAGTATPWHQWAIGDQTVKCAIALVALIPFWILKERKPYALI